MADEPLSTRILYEDNHLIVVNKLPGELAQGDHTGDPPLSDLLKEYLAERESKPGKVFLGVTHRLDRPTSGALLYAKTSKALSRMNQLFREGTVAKSYWALTAGMPESPEGRMEDWLFKESSKNKSFVVSSERKGAKRAVLNYRLLASGERYNLMEITLETGRHHQIRCQLAARGLHIRGDLKYGARRSNPDGGISLHARLLSFEHPIGEPGRMVRCVAPPPHDALWDYFLTQI